MQSILFILIGLALLAVGAEMLVRGSSSLALKLGVTPLVVGLTIVALGTSAPELAVSVSAALDGNSAIALGNVVGSNIANIGLILALGALIRPITSNPQAVKRDVPLMIAITFALVALLLDGEISRLDGALLLGGGITYIVWTYISARKNNGRAIDDLPRARRAAWIDLALIVVGLGLLVFGARALLDGVIAIAQALGISPVIIALTIVAVGTSLPELATTIIASRKGEADIGIGNAVGSNIFNILLILGVTALLQPIQARDLRVLDLGALIFFAIALLPLMIRGNRLSRSEGAILLIAYALYVFALLS
ncbi:MAG: calcium/sodium antiporter [Anaerolineales bacterium]|nr:calcium/sodium antiporter [Anaerolineales bacterium]